MKPSAYLSLGIATALGVWMVSGAFSDSAGTAPSATGHRVTSRMKVLVTELRAEPVIREIVLQGQLEPRRRVSLRAETGGRVVALPLAKGARVRAGDLLVRLAEDDRRSQIAGVQAELENQRLQVDGHRKLKQQGLQAEANLKAAEAALAASRAELERLRLDLSRTELRAPFDGVLETRAVEIGSFVDRGDAVVELVERSQMLAVGQIPQQSASQLALGQRVKIRLLDGRRAEGEIVYLASVAETGTRSFRVEAALANPDGALPAGVSAELRVAVGEETAHFLSPAALTLDGRGQVGVKSVGKEDRVQFHPVTLVRTQADGVWVAGLPEHVRVIVQGQNFVAQGENVEPVTDSVL